MQTSEGGIMGRFSRTFSVLARVHIAAAIAATTVVTHAADIFLRLDGILGDSTAVDFRDQIELLSYSQSFRGGALPSAGGSRPGQPTCGEIIVTKQIDRSSPRLIARVLGGTAVRSGDITFTTADGGGIVFYRVRLNDVVITGIEQADAPGQQRIVERVSLNARSFRFQFTTQRPDGSPEVAGFGWDCDENRAL